MEVWFKEWDYVLGDYEEVISSSEASEEIIEAKGSYYEGKYVSRELKKITFGGVGIVARPADKDAVILSVANKDDEESKGGTQNMPEKKEDVTPEVTVDLTPITSAIAALTESIQVLLPKEDDPKEKEIVGLNDTIAGLNSKIEELNSEIEKIHGEKASLQTDVLRRDRRDTLLKEELFVEEKVEAKLDKIMDMSDDAFNEYVNDMKDVKASIEADKATEAEEQKKAEAARKKAETEEDEDEGDFGSNYVKAALTLAGKTVEFDEQEDENEDKVSAYASIYGD